MKVVVTTNTSYGESETEHLWEIQGLVVPERTDGAGEHECPYRIRYWLSEQPDERVTRLADNGTFQIMVRCPSARTTMRLAVDYLAPSRDAVSGALMFTPYSFETDQQVLVEEKTAAGGRTIRISNTGAMQLRGDECRRLLEDCETLEIESDGYLQLGSLFSDARDDDNGSDTNAMQLNGRTMGGAVLYSSVTLRRIDTNRLLHVHVWNPGPDGNFAPIRLGRGHLGRTTDFQTSYSPLLESRLWNTFLGRVQAPDVQLTLAERQLGSNIRCTRGVSRHAASLCVQSREGTGEEVVCRVQPNKQPVFVQEADTESGTESLQRIEAGSAQAIPVDSTLQLGTDRHDLHRNPGVAVHCRVFYDGEGDQRTIGAVVLQIADPCGHDERGPQEQHVWLRRGMVLKNMRGDWNVTRPGEFATRYRSEPPLSITADTDQGRVFLIGGLVSGMAQGREGKPLRICAARGLHVYYDDGGARIDVEARDYSPLPIDYSKQVTEC